MFITPLLLALVLAFVFTLIFAALFRGQSWGAGIFFFFLILFLATWAGGLWLTPIGPLWWGVPWLSFFLVALIVGLLLAALTPDRRRRPYARSTEPPGRRQAETAIALDVFFWVLIVGLLIAIMARYFMIL
jgi:hypothetical protein